MERIYYNFNVDPKTKKPLNPEKKEYPVLKKFFDKEILSRNNTKTFPNKQIFTEFIKRFTQIN